MDGSSTSAPPPMDIQAIIKTLEDALWDLKAGRYTTLAGCTIVIYDLLLTINSEYKFVWQRKHSLSSFLYLFNKYVSLVFLFLTTAQMAEFGPVLSKQYCAVVVVAGGLAQAFAAVSATWLLTLRLFALMGDVRYAKTVLYIFFALSYSAYIALILATLIPVARFTYYDPIATICTITPDALSLLFRFIYLPPILYESTITIMTLWQTISYSRLHSSTTPLLMRLASDGVIYFFAITSLQILNCIIWAFLPQSLMTLSLYLMWGLTTTLISRFFLGLRETTTYDPFASTYGTTLRRDTTNLASHTVGGRVKDGMELKESSYRHEHSFASSIEEGKSRRQAY